MKKYIGVKMVSATPAIRKGGKVYEADENFHPIESFPRSMEPEEKGYKVVYPDGYTSWSPKQAFEDAYYPLSDETKITESDVDNFIIPNVGTRMGAKTTVVMDTTLTGFDTVGVSACVDPANYNQEIGEKYAREDIKSKVWGHLGFVLQWAKNGLTHKK